MTDEQIVNAAKSAEKKTEFGELVHSKVSRGVNSAYGIGFLEGAEWAREQMMKEAREVMVTTNLANRPVIYLDQLKGFQYGDKVRIIVLKKEDEK